MIISPISTGAPLTSPALHTSPSGAPSPWAQNAGRSPQDKHFSPSLRRLPAGRQNNAACRAAASAAAHRLTCWLILISALFDAPTGARKNPLFPRGMREAQLKRSASLTHQPARADIFAKIMPVVAPWFSVLGWRHSADTPKWMMDKTTYQKLFKSFDKWVLSTPFGGQFTNIPSFESR